MKKLLTATVIFAATMGGLIAADTEPAPPFNLRDGEGLALTDDVLTDNVTVLFYETRETIDLNRPFKLELAELRREFPQATEIKVLAVVDCSSAVWPLTSIWRKNLREHSRLENLTIYGDWNGAMRRDYRMHPGTTNLLVIDRRRKIVSRTHGAWDAAQRSTILALIRNLAADG